jgi:hypothetical protein
MHHGLEQIGLSIDEMDKWISKPSCEDTELQKLISKCLGMDLELLGQMAEEEVSSRLSRFRPFSVLRALASASILS